MTNNTVIAKDLANKKLNVTRDFNAPVEKVWKAWTEAELLDKWWAPKPWKAITKTMDFSDGGFWLYCMAGPNGEAAWCKVAFTAIVPQFSFKSTSMFCDENGVPNNMMPLLHWFIEFKATENGTRVEATISFDSDDDLQKIVAMGFEGGFTMGLNNLEELLAE